ncbi:hypothetical protein P8452_64591 [Trifolium repens]|nr:hypothetical protein QL285_085871 [Trifolium repens]WJX81746.1 hypothetical protein P8452_64591 [Trifolium repens]
MSDEDFKVDELNEASDDDSDDDSYEDEEKKIKRMRMRKDFDVVEELEREVMMDKESGIFVTNEEVDYSDYGSAANSTTIFEKKKGSFDPMEGCSSSSNQEASKKQKANSVENNVSNDSDSHEENKQYGKRIWNSSDKQKKKWRTML